MLQLADTMHHRQQQQPSSCKLELNELAAVPSAVSDSQLPAASPLGKAPQLQAYHLATVAPNGEQVRVSLNNASTWRKFSRKNTEMIVTKAGRRMFPSLSLAIAGLDAAKKYEVYVTLLQADRHALKFQRGVWLANGQGETYPPPDCATGLAYVHPDSPASGRHWAKQEVTFMKLKLTNKLDAFASDPGRNGTMIFAYSMHKYLPVVHISEVPSNPSDCGRRFYTSVVFPGTEFITVTAYQNPELTDLKIQFNPYAKGIRNQTDRSSTLMIDTFRPTVQALNAATGRLPGQAGHPATQSGHPAFQSPSAPAVQFGSYPEQTDSAYGHWRQPLTSSVSSYNNHHHLRHQPYAIPPPSTKLAAKQQPEPDFENDADTESIKNEPAADTAAASAYPGYYYQHHPGQYFYQPAHPSSHLGAAEHHLYPQAAAYHQYQPMYYGMPPSAALYPPHEDGKAPQATAPYYYHHQHQDQQQQPEPECPSRYSDQVTPPPPSAQQLGQSDSQHDSTHNSGAPLPPLHQLNQLSALETPQQQQPPPHHLQHQQQQHSCSLLASSSHVTDSSPSGVSFDHNVD